MNLGAIIAAALGLAASLVSWFREKRQLQTGEALSNAKVLQEHHKNVEIAAQAKLDAAADIRRVPQSDSLPDDGFRRD